MWAGAAADAQVVHTHGVRCLAEFVYFPAGAHKRIQSDRERARVVAAWIGQRHERGLIRRGPIGHGQRGDMTLDQGADLLDRRQDGRGSAMAVQAHHVGAGRLQPLAGLGHAPALARRFLPMLRDRDHGRHLGVFLYRCQRHQRFSAPGEGFRHDVVHARIRGPADLFLEDPRNLLACLAAGRVIDVGIADVAGEQRAGLARDLFGDGQRLAVHLQQVLFPADDP